MHSLVALLRSLIGTNRNGDRQRLESVIDHVGIRRKRPVQVTRSREYQKNDNAHVEQRNNSLARRWLGYERIGFQELVPLLNYYYGAVVCPLMNHFYPSFKLHDKIRMKSRTRRIYKAPVTPYARVIASSYVALERKRKLRALHESLNPVTLTKEEARLRKRIDDALKRLRVGSDAQALLAVPLPPYHRGLCPRAPGIYREEELPVG